MKKIFLAICILFIIASVKSQGVVHIDFLGKQSEFNLEGNLFYLIDSTDQFTFEQVLSPEFDKKFIQSASASFAYDKGSFSQWYKIRIQNNTNYFQGLVLSINNPIISDITFFNTFDSSFFKTGFLHPFFQRPIIFKNYLFRLKVGALQSGVVCFKVQSQLEPEYLPISLITEEKAFHNLRTYSFIEGIFYAILAFFVFVVIILWRSESENAYGFLLSLLIVIGLLNMWRNGILFQYIWPNQPNFNYLSGRIIYSAYILSILLFEYVYLKVKKTNKYLVSFYTAGFLVIGLFMVSQLFVNSFGYFYYGFRILILLTLILSFWSMILSRKLKIPYFAHYSIALGLLAIDLFLVFFFLGQSFGLGFSDTNIRTVIVIGFFFILMYIFISKFRNSQLQVIGFNKNLEQLIERRTELINSQNDELKTQREELIQQKDTLQTQREELRAQKELLELNNNDLLKLSMVASKTNNLIYIFLPNGDLDWFNASFSDSLGITIEEYKRQAPLSIVDISSNNNIKHVLNTCLREKTVVAYESKLIDKEKNYKWYHTTLTPILDERDNVKYLIAIDTDITKLKQFEDELDQQRKDAEHQKNLAVIRKEELEVRQVEIMDSIRYAKRIQSGIMPKVKQIQRDFSDSFVLFLPKDIVSGDFYWYHRIRDKYFIAAVDCTGHGVPGAFMSIIGTYLLNSIIIYNGVTDPAEILKQLNRKIKIALKSDSRSQTSDGMDIALAVIDKNEKTVEFASALRPIILFSNGDFIEIKGDKIPITSIISGTSIGTFTNYKYPFNLGDMFYLFSDGITDQFGGKTGKKFLSKRFKQLLFEINPLSMREQKEIIKKSFDDWRDDAEQVDDVLVMGIRYKEDPEFYSYDNLPSS